MRYNVIAPVGDNLKDLFVGIKEFPTEKVYLITPKEKIKDANELKRKLEEFTIKTEIISFSGSTLEEMFKAFAKITSIHENDELLVNVATGDRMSTCAALSASYANGIKAFGVMNDQAMLMPIMKLSYYHELSANKMKMLGSLEENDFKSLKELSKELKMSISLLSYHINGTTKHKGLKQFRLIDTMEENKQLYVKLSEMGSLLLKGYLKNKH